LTSVPAGIVGVVLGPSGFVLSSIRNLEVLIPDSDSEAEDPESL
jgi:hypothetical protein